MDKLLKTIESLKVPAAFNINSDSNIPVAITSSVVAAIDAVNVKKKERISHCVTVTDAILTPSVQNLKDFEKILEHVSEVLFQLCNDPDSDIRLVAVDCINRIVRSLRGIFLNKFQLEVYREIKRDPPPRSLRTALNVFAILSSDIRPNRCRSFIQSLLPSLVQISKRTEELLYENLSTSFLQILKNLGLFLTDSDVRLLCKEYMKNLESSSTVVRRSSAFILIYICQFSRKPNIFLPKLLVEVIELLMPNLMEKNVSLLIGVLLCVRQCLGPLYVELEKSFPGVPDKEIVYRNIIQVYEICLILCNHDDHNVITTSLETLQQLLNCPVFEVIRRLTSPDGIQNSFDSDQWVPKTLVTTPPLHETQWKSIGSELSDSDEPSAFLLESELDIPTFRSELSSASTEAKDEDVDNNFQFCETRRDSDVFIMASTSETENSLEPQSDSEQLNNLPNTTSIPSETFPELQIGSLYEKNVPLYYCTRFLVYNFLLAGRKGYMRSDSEARVTVKVLAINCIINSIRLCPDVYTLTLQSTEEEELEKMQRISDVCLYTKHQDPLLRGSTFVLIGSYIRWSFRTNHGTFPGSKSEYDEFIGILNNALLDKSNIGVKYALSALSDCLVPISRYKETSSSVLEELFENLFGIITNPYWLVKVNLVEILSVIEWDAVKNYEQLQDRTLNLFLHLLSDEDLRVRSSTATALAKYIQSCANRQEWISGKFSRCYSRSVIENINCDIFKSSDKKYFHSVVSRELEKVLNRIIPLLSGLNDRHSIAGYYMALSSLSESFPPVNYKISWRCVGGNIPVLFSIVSELLRFSPIISDLMIHQNLLTLSSNIFLALIGDGKIESPVENNPIIGSRKNVSSYGLYLLYHSFSVIKLYNTILSSSNIGTNTTHAQKKQSPVLSPAKKFILKDQDKKVIESENDKKLKTPHKQQSISQGTSSVCSNQLKRIEESLQQSWKVYKSNLDPVVTHKFSSVLITALGNLGIIFDSIQYEFSGITTIIEEILSIAPTIFILVPTPTLKCMKSILRCLNSPSPSATIDSFCTVNSEDLFLDFQFFCDNFYKTLAVTRKSGSYQTPNDKSGLGAHIRSFEPIVISALKTYLASTDSSIQAEILSFVSELVKGHVNYAMVDSSNIFLNSVTKQLTFLEEGHVRNSAIVVDAIFEYFTQLSHMERGKKFIDTPKMLQLCDGLVASGQNPITNYIPALKKIVYDLFVKRAVNIGITNLEKKDLEAQREVIFQNILKLGHIPDALPVVFILLHGRRGISEAKWSTESGIIGKSILDSLEWNKLIINNMDHFYSMIGILFSVHIITLPSLEKIKLSLEKTLLIDVNDFVSLNNWMVNVNALWLVSLRLILHNDEMICGKMLLELLLKFVNRTEMIFKWPRGNQDENYYMEHLVLFLKASVSMLRKRVCEETISELRLEENLENFVRLTEQIINISKSFPALRRAYLEFLSVISYPHNSIMTSAETSSEQSLFSDIASLIKDMKLDNEGESKEYTISIYKNPRILSIVKDFESNVMKTNMEEELESDTEIDAIVNYNPMINWINRSGVEPIEARAIAEVLMTIPEDDDVDRVLNGTNERVILLSVLKHIFELIRILNKNGDVSASSNLLITLLSGVSGAINVRETAGIPQRLALLALHKVIHDVEVLEALIHDAHMAGINSNDEFLDANTYNLQYFSELWSVLSEILLWKASLQSDMTPYERSIQNNYISITVFVYSFEYLESKCKSEADFPLKEFLQFLKFAALSLNDETFQHFLKIGNHSRDILTCIEKFHEMLCKTLTTFCIHYIPPDIDCTWETLDKGGDCAQILRKLEFFNYVVTNFDHGDFYLDAQLTTLIKCLINALGRLDLLNNWLLTSHLGVRSHVKCVFNDFPIISYIPWDDLRWDKDSLMLYVDKLIIFGVVSKVQFEENWNWILIILNALTNENCDGEIIMVALIGIKKMLDRTISVTYEPDPAAVKAVNGLKDVNYVLKKMEPEFNDDEECIPYPFSMSIKKTYNEYGIDVTSCVRFLMELFSQWFDNPQINMTTAMRWSIVDTIVMMSKFFEDESQYLWMYNTILDLLKKQEKGDIVWKDLVRGMLIAAAKISIDDVEPENRVTVLSGLLKDDLSLIQLGQSDQLLEGLLVFFQGHPDCKVLINIVIPYLTASTQLRQSEQGFNETAWKVQLFIWIYCSWEDVPAFEQDLIPNILTALSSLNKVKPSIRLMILNALIRRVEIGHLKPDTKQKITKAALDTLKTPIQLVFFHAMRLFITIFYSDFSNFYRVDEPNPEVFMEMGERTDILFRLLRDENKMGAEMSSIVLPLLVKDFLPPSEILNRVISEFLSPLQTCPELLAETVLMIFKKANRDRKSKDALLVREWVKASLVNFLSSPDLFRTMWSLAIIFYGVAPSPESYSSLYTFTTFKANSSEVKKLFGKSVVSYFDQLSLQEQDEFLKLIRKGGSFRFAVRVIKQTWDKRYGLQAFQPVTNFDQPMSEDGEEELNNSTIYAKLSTF